MDRNNNNNHDNANNFDCNIDCFNSTCDDVRNHNQSRTNARMTSLNYQNSRTLLPSFSAQEYGRSNIDRMKDRQIAILIQKNNQLETELSAMRQKYPVLHEYSMMGQCSSGNKPLHIQIKLLTTALSEKFEELRQSKEELRQMKKEYELVMQERTTVHRELQEQTTEIDLLKGKIKILKEQQNYESLNCLKISDTHNGICNIQLNDSIIDVEGYTSRIADLEATIENVKSQNFRILNTVLDKYNKLQMILFNNVNSKKEFKSQTESSIKEKCISGNIKVIELKMMILNIEYERSSDIFDGLAINGGCPNKLSSHNIEEANTFVFSLRNDDRLLEIEGTSVVNWADHDILEYLAKFDANKVLKVIISRKYQLSGSFLSWQIQMDNSFVKTICLSPLWMVTRSPRSSCSADVSMLQLGDILQLNTNNVVNSNGIVSVNIIRLSPFPLDKCAVDNRDYDRRSETLSPINHREKQHHAKTASRNSKAMSVGSSDPLSGCLISSQSCFPVLPVKQKLQLFNENHSKCTHHQISDYDLSQYSNISVSSAPPVPPRSSTSLQYSFTENHDLHNAFNTNMEGIESREFGKEDVFVLSEDDKLNLSAQSAIHYNFHSSINNTSRELMSASFNCTSEFSSHKIPKLGKYRKVTLTVPSKMFCLKDLGLHLLHEKTEEPLISKSDVDVSVINRIFIRDIELDSIAQTAGLVEGDEIITINNHPVSKMTAEEAENAFLTNSLKQEKQKYSLLIKVQFNPLKMHELFNEKNLVPLNPNLPSIRFTRSMYDETNSSRSIHDSILSHRLNVIRSSSNLNIAGTDQCHDSKLKHSIVYHLKTNPRIIIINMYTDLKLIKIMGGCNAGIFITNVIYKDVDAEIQNKENIGNKLAVGDKIIEVNGEKFDRMIGDAALNTLNQISHQATIKVIYDPPGLLRINGDPFCQENFYMEATFSFSELHNPLTTFSGKRDKCASVCSRLDHLVINIPFIRNYHLRFEKHDILLVDATILPSTMTKSYQNDKNNPTDWHAWVVDRHNTKIRDGMIPSAFWVEKMLSLHKKSFKLPLIDKNIKSSMRSTPSSPISKATDFLSSTSTSFHTETSKLFPSHHASLSQKIFSRISFKNYSHSKTNSNDDTNKGISFQKFRPLRRLPTIIDSKRPVILLGAHCDTISMVLASGWPKQYIMAQSNNTSDYFTKSKLHQIITVTTKEFITELHKKHIYPIVILLNYKSAKQIRQLRICKTSHIKVSKSDCNKYFALVKEYETQWSYLINESVYPSHVKNTCETIINKVESIQKQNIWLQVDHYEYSD